MPTSRLLLIALAVSSIAFAQNDSENQIVYDCSGKYCLIDLKKTAENQAGSHKKPFLESHKKNILIVNSREEIIPSIFSSLPKNTQKAIDMAIDYSGKYITDCGDAVYYVTKRGCHGEITEFKNIKKKSIFVSSFELTEADQMNGYSWKGILQFTNEGGVTRGLDSSNQGRLSCTEGTSLLTASLDVHTQDWQDINPLNGMINFPINIRNGQLQFNSNQRVGNGTFDFGSEFSLISPLQCQNPMKAETNYHPYSANDAIQLPQPKKIQKNDNNNLKPEESGKPNVGEVAL